MIFYDISNDNKFRDIDYAEGTDWEGIICSKYDGHQRAGIRIGQLQIKIKNNRIGDFLWTFLSESIITDKVAKIFIKNKASGYKLKNIQVINTKFAFNLWEFIVTGNGGDAHSDSGIFLKERCIYCGMTTYSAFENGIIINEKNWDKSDIFTVNGYPKHILVTEKIAELIRINHLTGVKITPSHELKWPKGVIKP